MINHRRRLLPAGNVGHLAEDGRNGGEMPETIEPFETFDAADWNSEEPEPPRWITNGQIPCGEPGILNGDGG